MAQSTAELCQQRGITIEQLADRSGLATDRAAAIAEGRWTPSPKERSKIAAVFGVPAEEICWGHKTPIQRLYGQGPS